MRPSKLFEHSTYSASSSRRACTLRLPSVVCNSFLSSLKLRESLTARALTIPKRIRSWMMRSRFGRALSRVSRSAIGLAPLSGRVLGEGEWFGRAIAVLATVPPGDYDSKRDVDHAEPQREKKI